MSKTQEKQEIIDHPAHYNTHPSGIEVIEIAENMSFNLGNAFKYVARHRLKCSSLDDLNEAAWYIQRERDLIRAEIQRGNYDRPGRLPMSIQTLCHECIAHEDDKTTRAVLTHLWAGGFSEALQGIAVLKGGVK